MKFKRLFIFWFILFKGKVFGALCASCGIIVIAMPVSLLTGQFNDAFNFNKKKEKVIRKYTTRMKKQAENATNQDMTAL
jgi:hypothetical protein